MSSKSNNSVFETKVRNLISATLHLDVAKVLVLRRLTLADPESLKWVTLPKLGRVFDVLVTKALEREGLPKLAAARDLGYADYVPPGKEEDRAEDLAILHRLGDAILAEAEDVTAVMNRVMAITPKTNIHKTRIKTEPVEPAPLFAAQLPEAEADNDPSNLPFTNFQDLFDNTLAHYLLTTLEPLWAQPRKSEKIPYGVSKQFAKGFSDFARTSIFPKMRQNRRIAALELNHNWAEVGGDKLIELLQEPGTTNPIMHNWETCWDAMTPQKGKKLPKDENPWLAFKSLATNGDFTPPTSEDINILKDMIRWDREDLEKAWKELSQLYAQEFAPGNKLDQAREGAFRDGLLRWTELLPEHVGEFFALKAHFQYERIDVRFLRKLLVSFGRTEAERNRKAPILAGYLETMGSEVEAAIV